MKNKFKILFLIAFLSNYCFAQNNEEIALQKGEVAIKLMDNGKIEESIMLLEECQKLDPENFDYPYEIAYANYLKKDYKKTIGILEKLENYKNINAQLYSLWGNSYDNLDNPKKAIEIYDNGIKKFPQNGLLYLEKGVVYEFEKEYNNAIETYKKGISAEPKYPSNYYRIANLYLNSDDKVPGLIYGEIFLNLERTTNRTKEMSKNLFDAYKNSIVFENNEWKKLNLCKQMKINPTQFEKDKKLPLCMVFGKWFTFGLLNSRVKEYNLDSISKIRKEFIKNYFEKDNKDYPNILFEYQKKMIDNEIFEAYNHYIFQMGATEEFSEWLKTNNTEYEKFVEWYTKNENIINPTEANYFQFIN
jgi:tetratricopeptide (TPR) repeat protein